MRGKASEVRARGRTAPALPPRGYQAEASESEQRFHCQSPVPVPRLRVAPMEGAPSATQQARVELLLVRGPGPRQPTRRPALSAGRLGTAVRPVPALPRQTARGPSANYLGAGRAMKPFWHPVRGTVVRSGSPQKQLGHGLYELWARCCLCGLSGPFTGYVTIHRQGLFEYVCEPCWAKPETVQGLTWLGWSA